MTDQVHEQRALKVRRAILKTLGALPGYLMPENVMHGDLAIHLAPPALLSEFRAELAELEQRGLVVIMHGSMGGPRLIKLTDAGRAQLTEML